jgi:hypothetical protein
VSRAAPPGNGRGSTTTVEPLKLSRGDSISPSLDAVNGNLQQPKAEDLVRKFLKSSIRDDTSIPFCLRTLEQAERELRHNGLALAISAAEWHYCDLVIWQSYPAKFARAEAWKHIGIGFDWIRHLRRRNQP